MKIYCTKYFGHGIFAIYGMHCVQLYTEVWSKCPESGDSEVPLPTGYGTFLRVDEFKAILLGGATREGRRNDTYCLAMHAQTSF